jgi:sulfite exporter TauE/SafE
MTIIAAGFVLGVAASLHCVVMCGPLTLAILARRSGRAAIAYHGARVLTYGLLGVAIGTAGHLAILAGLERVLSVVAGLVLIGAAAGRMGWASTDRGLRRHVTTAVVRAARAAREKWGEASPAGIASAGVLNGLLPCAPVYAALTAAAALGDSGLSGGFMLAFGAGTLPALAAARAIADLAPRLGRGRWSLMTPAVLALLGVLLMARGLIPSHHHPPGHPVDDHVTYREAHALRSESPRDSHAPR